MITVFKDGSWKEQNEGDANIFGFTQKEPDFLVSIPAIALVEEKIDRLLQIVCDPENQPHQFVGDSDKLKTAFSLPAPKL